MIILISGITGFNEPKTQPGCIPRPCVCVYVHTDATILGDACTHWLSGPEDFFNISPRRCSLHLQTRIVYLSGLTLVTNCGPGARHREGEGLAKGAARGAVDDEGEKNCVDRSRRIRDKIHGTTRVHATWFARCYEIIPLLLPLPLLSSFLFPSLSPSPRSTADFPATGFCLSALLSSLEKRTRGIRSLRRSGLIGTSLISRLWGPLLLLLPLPPSPPPWNLAWLMYTAFLLTSCNDEDAFVARKERSSVNLHSEPPVTFHPVRG